MTMREEFEAWCVETYGPNYRAKMSGGEYDFSYAAYRAGAEAMRERAAKVADEWGVKYTAGNRIRALPLDDQP